MVMSLSLYSRTRIRDGEIRKVKDFYNERKVNRDGLQCLHFLNEIISDFDEGCDVSYSHVRSMVEFAIALKNNLESINQHSFNSYKLRIVESVWLAGQWDKEIWPDSFHLYSIPCRLSLPDSQNVLEKKVRGKGPSPSVRLRMHRIKKRLKEIEP